MDSCLFSYNEIILTDISDQFNGLSIHSFQSHDPIAALACKTVLQNEHKQWRVISSAGQKCCYFLTCLYPRLLGLPVHAGKTKIWREIINLGDLWSIFCPGSMDHGGEAGKGVIWPVSQFEEECWHVGAIPYALLAAVNKRWLVHLISQQLSGILAKLYSKMFKGWLQGKGRQYSFCLPGGHVCSSDVTWKLWKDPIKALNIQLKFPDHKQLIFLSSTLFLVSNWFYKTSNMYCY